MHFIRNILATLLVFILGSSANASDTLRVGIAGSSPFVIDTTADTGISLEIWDALSEKMQWPYRKVYFEDIPQALDALEQGKVDAVAGPVSITSERAEKVRFTQPYFQSSLSILSRVDEYSLWQRISPFFTQKFFIAVCAFLFILAIVGTLLWLAERKENKEQFTDKPLSGILNGMWCAIVTMTTTGYGDITPKTLGGRAIASIWMVISLIFATTMIAGIASTVTLTGMATSTIKTSEELKSKRVAVIKDSPAEEFVRDHGGKAIYAEDLDQCIRLLTTKSAAAVVYDRPQLQYYLQQHPDKTFALSTGEYDRQGYGFAFPERDTSLHQININLLGLKESGSLQQIISNWLGSEKNP